MANEIWLMETVNKITWHWVARV